MDMDIQNASEAHMLEALHSTDDSSRAQPLKYYFSCSSGLKVLGGGSENDFATPSQNLLISSLNLDQIRQFWSNRVGGPFGPQGLGARP